MFSIDSMSCRAEQRAERSTTEDVGSGRGYEEVGRVGLGGSARTSVEVDWHTCPNCLYQLEVIGRE